MTAFDRGYAAAKAGVKFHRNPYLTGTLDHFEWQRGFLAYHEENRW